ncbi:DUF4349 domain-containing protein [Halomicroarcula sp. S1AR25-4]|uniref:DUF4349 domain-containing protein n=1 Tax=Haloarcula sp. S1AR25-4 TaxID=2950538 RepID=UPI00287620CD|nr:DUF4349 domain-containing protein [Halomicroarcula sp. S1AR25-4]MDS0276485.1 DUF4349 domain-containing protein [Halomicroarcula sp. S1AR25-4]
MSRNSLVVALALTLLLAGCAGMGGNPAGGDGAELSADGGDGSAPAAEGANQQSADTSGGGSAQVDAAVQQRAIIKTGRMVVEVENFSQSRTAIASQARQYGGYVSGSNQRLHRSGNETWISGYVVVRVPNEQYRAMQDDIAAEGTVLSEETQTDDVTDQLVDLEARLENLRQRRDRLRTFYDEANDTEELLRIEEQLSEVQGQIEQLEAKQRSLEQRVAYSTIRVELQEPEPGISQIRTQYHEQSLAAVFLRSVNDVYVFGRATLVTLAAAAPWLGVLAVPAFGLRRVLRGRRLPFVGGSENSSDHESSGDSDSGSDEKDVRTAATASDDETESAADDER